MEALQVAQLLNDTLSSDVIALRSATASLDRISLLPHFPFSLLSITTGGENQGQRVAAATYLKNIVRRYVNGDGTNSKVSKEFKDHLFHTLLQVEPAVLKVLVEVFRIIVVAEFVEKNCWPELVPELWSAIWNSNLITNGASCQCNTINALTVLQALIRPFQYFLNPKFAKEPVPPQLELITKEILVPMLGVFNHLIEKVLSAQSRTEADVEKILLLVCKCIYLTVRSHMPSVLVPLLPSLCRDLIALLESLSFIPGDAPEDGQALRMKTGKRSLLIFSALVTRHRKYADKLMPDIIKCTLKIVKGLPNISKLDFLSERTISLAFDVISHILETGPGWRLVSPHFLNLLDSAIFPALILNEKDISEWEEDTEEYMRKNHPSELEEISGWREDLFTARKSAINLLGVIAMSKGPPTTSSRNDSAASFKRKKGEKNKKDNHRSSMGELLVLPFLSKFPIPSDANSSKAAIVYDYFGVLMAYSGLQEFLKEQKPGYVTLLIRTRFLPLYVVSAPSPHLLAAANWVLGELSSCLPEELSADIYSSLVNAMAMPDNMDTSYHPERISAAVAIMELVENEYPPPDWLPVLQAVFSGITIEEEEETSILFQLLCSLVEAGDENIADHIPFMVSSLVEVLMEYFPPIWSLGLKYALISKVVVKGITALATMAASWESFLPEETEQIESNNKWASGSTVIGKSLSTLLQQTWLTPVPPMDEGDQISPSPTCLNDLSTLLRSITLSVTGSDVITQLKLPELLLAWANLIADWHAWEESEDLSVFDCIEEAVDLSSKYELKNFLVRPMPSPPAPPVPPQSIIEGIGVFVREAVLQYPSATGRACSCIHRLLHVPGYSADSEVVKQSLATAFCQAAFSCFMEIQSKFCRLWKPLLLVIASCYLCYPDTTLSILEKDVKGGSAIWGSALAFVCTSSEHGLESKPEMKLAVLTLAKVIEQLPGQENSGGSLLTDCLKSLMEASVKLKEMQEETDDEEDEEDDEEDEDDDYDNDSEDDECDETEEAFLERYAKVAEALENGTVEEGEAEDQEHDIELGAFEEVDEQSVVLSVLERVRHFLVPGKTLSPEVISSFLSAFPESQVFIPK